MYIQVRNTDTLHARTHYLIAIISVESMYNLGIKSPCHGVVFSVPYARKRGSRWMAHTSRPTPDHTTRNTGSSHPVRSAIYTPQTSRLVVEKVTIIQNPAVVSSDFRTKFFPKVSSATIEVGTPSTRRTRTCFSMLLCLLLGSGNDGLL
jgi:hypothetical protein